MSDTKSPQPGSVLTNLEHESAPPSASSATSSSRRPSSPDELKAISFTALSNHSSETLAPSNGSKVASSSKDGEPETKKRKRSQRACVRCRGQKLKCDGVFPCARCLKLKLVCKEPTDPSSSSVASGLPASSKDETAHSSSSGRPSTGQSPRHSHQTTQNLYHAEMATSPTSSYHPHGNAQGHNHVGSSSDNSHGHHHHMSHAGHTSPSWICFSLSDTTNRLERLEATVARLVDRLERPTQVRLAPEHARAAGMPYATALRDLGDSSKMLDMSSRPLPGRLASLASRDHLRSNRAVSPTNSDLEVDELAHDGQSEANSGAGDGRYQDHRAHALHTLSKLSTEPRPATYSAAREDPYAHEWPRKEVYDPTREGRERDSRRPDPQTERYR